MARGKRVGIHETGEIFDSVKSLTEEIGVCKSNFTQYINKKPWYGLHISYLELSPYCIHCGIILDKNNWYESDKKRGHWICKACFRIRAYCNKHHLNKQDLVGLCKKQEGICPLCGDKLDPTFHIDHRFPVKKGGKTEISNLQFLCKMCNIGKYGWSEEDYINHCIKVAKYNRRVKGTDNGRR